MFRTGLDNLKLFVVSRPPLVLFLIFLTSLATTLMILTAYLANNDIRDPTVAYDWNNFLQNFAKVDFCVENKSNGTVFPSFNVTALPYAADDNNLVDKSGFRNFSINVLLVIHPTPDFLARSNNLTHLSGSVSGKQLGLEDSDSPSFLDVSFELGINRTLKPSMCLHDSFFVGRRCPDVIFPTCAHVRGPASLFPNTSRVPSTCVASSPSSTPGINGGNPVETHAKIHAHREIASSGWGATPYCPRGPVAHTQFKMDQTLTLFLGLEDRSVINLHLLHTTFFLLIMVFSVLCVAACKNHSKNANSINNNNKNSTKIPAQSNDHRGNYSLVA